MDYRATLNLPQTTFKMKANLSQREPEFLKQWDDEKVYQRMQEQAAGKPLYILHDGPPYANGHIHLGTAFNKILKDIILKSKRMAGFNCPYVPGWDCHGLPIEHNVDKELGEKKKEIPTLSFRAACRRYAEKWIKIQREEFVRLGVMGDWNNPYLTINFAYEAAIAREFNRFLLNGGVIRSKKPVYWCSSCQTALAEAEVEYHDHSSPSIYVKFKVDADLSDVHADLRHDAVFIVIWTTTPWTLPANLAVALHPDFTYSAVRVNGEIWILATDLVESACEDMGIEEYEVLSHFSARPLEGRKCRHPFIDRESLIILAPYVTLEGGTGCVHTAPGHGREDYLSGIKYNLPILSPVDNKGHMTAEAGIYEGLFVYQANKRITSDMTEKGVLVSEKSVSHSYPHCWRCKKPVIFRATEQWFIAMDNNNLREKALKTIAGVTWTPGWGMERIRGMVENRPDWCLSRQRAWGVPLTVFSCTDCGEVYKDEKVAEVIDKLFREEGADAWFRHDTAAFLGEGTACRNCGCTSFLKENDILDVWFDSGVSYAAVLEEREQLASPADLYLEGSDQHRGWFQSSLLAAVGTRGYAPYKGVLTHGFVVDGAGKKMSKSVGNVIAPSEVIKQYGAEILRMWVASEDYRDDIKISNDILRQLSDAYRKIRNTLRYILGNLYDYDPIADRIVYEDLSELDQWALSQFEQLREKQVNAYEHFEFHTVFHSLYQFCTVTLSSLYLDILKDRLYTSGPASLPRRSAQTVLYHILDGMLRLMAPVMTFTAAETWEHLPADPGREANVFLASFPVPKPDLRRPNLDRKWDKLLAIRSELTKVLEQARQDKIIGHSLEANILLDVKGDLAAFISENWETLKTIAIVSSLQHVENRNQTVFMASEQFPELHIAVQPAAGQKCERCWLRAPSVGENETHPQLCARCSTVVADLLTAQ